MASILVRGGTLVTLDRRRRIIKDGAVAIEDNKIVAVGKREEVTRQYPSAGEIVEASGKLVLPGLVDSHVHHTQMLARGIADDLDLITWIHDRILPYESVMTDEDTYTSAMLCCLEMIKTGTTTTVDPGGYRMEHVARALDESGMRGIVAWASMDTDTPDRPVPRNLLTTTEGALKANLELIKAVHKTADGRIRARAGIRIEPNASSTLIKEIDKLAKKHGVGVEMHAAVSREQVDVIKKRTGLSMIRYLKSLGVLGPHWLLIHMGWIDDEEVEILRATDTRIAHVPGASMKGAYGSARYGKFPELLRAGVIVGLGCDSSAANNSLDMFRAMWQVASVHKEVRYDPHLVSPEEAIEMATIKAAKAVLWDEEIGSIEVGKKADVIIVDVNRSNWIPLHDFSIVPNIVYAGDGHV